MLEITEGPMMFDFLHLKFSPKITSLELLKGSSEASSKLDGIKCTEQDWLAFLKTTGIESMGRNETWKMDIEMRSFSKHKCIHR